MIQQARKLFQHGNIHVFRFEALKESLEFSSNTNYLIRILFKWNIQKSNKLVQLEGELMREVQCKIRKKYLENHKVN